MRSGQKAAAILLLVCTAQWPTRAADPSAAPAPTVDKELEAGEADAVEPPRKLVKWNEFDWPASTFRFGFGFLVDYANYVQDEESKQQVALDEDVGLRDLRVLFRGKFKTKRPLSWQIGYMYDGADDEWHFRLTGLQIGIPEWHGNLFIGRTKEGYSAVKVMTGYFIWTTERSPAADAFVPILGDGLKWSGYFDRPRVFFSLGVYGDELSEDEKFSTYDHQMVTRVGWQPILSEDPAKVLHVAVMARDGRPDEKSIRFRARPEAFLAPYFVDTGSIAADHARTTGVEAWYRSGPVLFGGEYSWQTVDALSGENLMFHGGDVSAAWLITGETRPYNAAGGFFEAVSPSRTVFEGGKGAWEAVLHYSYIDLDSGSIAGGKLWRLTPLVKWHMSDNFHLELGYGYSSLDRFGVVGHTQFFQSRIGIIL